MAAVVVIAAVAEVPGLIELGLTAHCGACAGDGCTVQVKETAPLNPPTVPAVTVAVELCPWPMGFGVKSDAEREKSGVKSKVAVIV